MSTTATMQIPNVGLLHVIADTITDISAADYTGLFGDCTLGLFTSWPGFSAGLVIGDLTPADYTGYATQSVVWGAPYTNAQNKPAVTGGELVYRPTDGVTPNQIIGAYLISDGGELAAVGTFADSIPLESALDQAVILPTVVFDTANNYGTFLAQN